MVMKTKREFMLCGKNGYDISCMEWTCERECAVLVCLHGFAGDKYSSVIRALAETQTLKSVRVITFDWPGHGKSPADGKNLTIENCMLDLDSVIQEIRKGNQPVYLFATSFGGFVGLNYIDLHPSTFSKVVLRSPALNMPKTFLSFLTSDDIHVLENGGTVDKGFERPLLLDKSFIEDLFRHRLLPDEYPSGVPGLIIQGDMDDVVDPLDSVKFAEKNGLSLHMIGGADHRYKKRGNIEEILSAAIPFLVN